MANLANPEIKKEKETIAILKKNLVKTKKALIRAQRRFNRKEKQYEKHRKLGRKNGLEAHIDKWVVYCNTHTFEDVDAEVDEWNKRAMKVPGLRKFGNERLWLQTMGGFLMADVNAADWQARNMKRLIRKHKANIRELKSNKVGAYKRIREKIRIYR